MTEAQAMEVLLSIVSLGILWFLVSSAWPSYRVAAFRQDLFDIRDALFDLGLEEPELFEHESYRQLRERINITIRFAHKFTTTRLLVTIFFLKNRITVSEDWTRTLRGLPSETQANLRRIQKSFLFRLGCYMLRVPLWFLRLLERMVSSAQKELARRELTKKLEVMEAQAAKEVAQERELAHSH